MVHQETVIWSLQYRTQDELERVTKTLLLSYPGYSQWNDTQKKLPNPLDLTTHHSDIIIQLFWRKYNVFHILFRCEWILNKVEQNRIICQTYKKHSCALAMSAWMHERNDNAHTRASIHAHTQTHTHTTYILL